MRVGGLVSRSGTSTSPTPTPPSSIPDPNPPTPTPPTPTPPTSTLPTPTLPPPPTPTLPTSTPPTPQLPDLHLFLTHRPLYTRFTSNRLRVKFVCVESSASNCLASATCVPVCILKTLSPWCCNTGAQYIYQSDHTKT